MKMRNNKKGFSMIELLAAVTILGILSIIGIVAVTRILSKAHEEYYKNSEKNLVLAAQSYVQSNKSKLPKIIGKKTKITAKELREANYLKSDLTTYNGKTKCDEDKTYVNVFKYGKSDYSYTAYLTCKPDREAKEQVKVDTPTLDVNFPGSIEDLKTANVTIDIQGSGDSTVKLLSYTYTLYYFDNNTNKYVQLMSSGTVESREYKISKKIDLSKYTLHGSKKIKVIVSATNINGNSNSGAFINDYQDKTPPKCIIKDEDNPDKPEGVKLWVNTQRTITIECDDQDGSGCEKQKYTKTFTKENKTDYITIKDIEGNEKKCEVTTYIDKTKPSITVNAYKCDKNGNKTGNSMGHFSVNDATSTGTFNSSSLTSNANGWLNAANYPYGVCFEVTGTDNYALGSKGWAWNKAGIAKNGSGYTTITEGSKNETFDVTGKVAYTTTKKYSHSLTAEGHRYGRFTFTDAAGNTSYINVNMLIDRTAPNCPTVTARANGSILAKNTWTYAPQVVFTFGFTADTYNWDWYTDSTTNDKKIGDITYKNWGKNVSPSTKTGSIEGQGYRKILVVVKDEALNERNCQSHNYQIDHCESKTPVYGNWGTCTNNPPCGTGTQTRTGTYYSNLDTSHTCGAAPVQSQACQMGVRCEDYPYQNSDGTLFATLRSAMDGTSTNKKIWLIIDKTEDPSNPVLNASKTLTFDSSGKRLKLTANEFEIKNGTFNIIAGTIETSNQERAAIKCSGGTVNLQGGTIDSPYKTDTYAGCEAVKITGGTMNMSAGKIESGSGSESGYARGVLINSGSFNMTGGHIYVNATKSGKWGGTGINAQGGTVTITGGTVQTVKGGEDRCLLCGNGGVIKAKDNAVLKWGGVVRNGGVVFWLADSSKGSVCIENSVDLHIEKDGTHYSSSGVKFQKNC